MGGGGIKDNSRETEIVADDSDLQGEAGDSQLVLGCIPHPEGFQGPYATVRVYMSDENPSPQG